MEGGGSEGGPWNMSTASCHVMLWHYLIEYPSSRPHQPSGFKGKGTAREQENGSEGVTDMQVNISARFFAWGGGGSVFGMVGMHRTVREFCVIFTPSSTGTSYPHQ
jgi:hypothetical protein